MGIDAFVLRYEMDVDMFTSLFLASADFDLIAHKRICQELGLSHAGKRTELIDRIAGHARGSDLSKDAILNGLVARNKRWILLKFGGAARTPQLLDPRILVYSEGDATWYGPWRVDFDPSAVWYIRPVFVPHFEVAPIDGMDRMIPFRARWLVFARIGVDSLSLHWRGFSHVSNMGEAGRYSSQFPYWRHIPELCGEIERLTDASFRSVNLYDLVLHRLWDRYRDDPAMTWIDNRIRAEAGGVSLQAHAGVVDVDVPGIQRLANTIGQAVQLELQRASISLPPENNLNEVLLRTLIREFGAVSYEFSLAVTDGERMCRAHGYFGAKPDSSSPDSFGHLLLYNGYGTDLGQLRFFLDNLRG